MEMEGPDADCYEKKEVKDEFKYEFSDDVENDDEYEKTLEKDIEINCEFKVYVDKLEIEDRSDSELVCLEKQDIIDFKNYQIQKLRAYIYSLEKEKEDLIENFKTTTNVLLEKIKENEFRDSGIRPETPFIAKKLKAKTNSSGSISNIGMGANNNMGNNSNSYGGFDNMNSVNMGMSSKNNFNNNNRGNKNNKNTTNNNTYPAPYKNNYPTSDDNEDSKSNNNRNKKIQRCPNCTKEIPDELFLQHSLDCLRNKIRCKKCNELIEEKFKKEHLLEWRTKEKLLQAINSKNAKMLQQCLDHGASPNKILNEETGESILHIVVSNENLNLLESLISTELNMNCTDKNNDTPLIAAINNGNSKFAKFLIDLGADLTKRNAADMSPLMIACQKGMRDLVEFLISNNADINEKASISGLTPLSCCKDEELALYLIQNGAKIQNRPVSSSIKK